MAKTATAFAEIKESEFARRSRGQVEADLVRYDAWREKYKIDANKESILEWDRTENKKQLLNWDEDYCINLGLLSQAQIILTVYTRFRVKVGSDIIDFPGRLSTGKNHYDKTEDMTKTQIQAVISAWQEQLRIRYIRIRLLGAGKKAIAKAIRAAVVAGERDYSASGV